ncbi:MAG: CoA-binding protein [Verrucomicrobia bacterium]|nr:CoA-binding protein [Verrucomicrobiota bacterium]
MATKQGCDELWLNPGAESDEVVAKAERLGLNVIQACSIVGHGVSPVRASLRSPDRVEDH